MKLGDAEMEPLNTEISLSILEARALFMSLIPFEAKEATEDLLRIYNKKDIPIKLTRDPAVRPWATYYVLGHFLGQPVHDQLVYKFGPHIRKTPIHELIDFVEVNKRRLDRCLKESRVNWRKATKSPSDKLIVATAYRKLIPNWQALIADPGAENLCSLLLEWANKWNLTDEWCLDFALNALITFKIKYVDRHNLFGPIKTTPEYYLHYERDIEEWQMYAWSDAVFEIYQEKNRHLYAALADIPVSERFTFEFQSLNKQGDALFRLKKYFPVFSCLEDEFRRAVESKFWRRFFTTFSKFPGQLVGQTKHVSDEITRFHNDLDKYIGRCKKQNRKVARPVAKKNTGESHFRWLIAFQILGLTYSKIGRRNARADKAIEVAIKSTAKLIVLHVRPAERPGRPVGIVEFVSRRRVSSNK